MLPTIPCVSWVSFLMPNHILILMELIILTSPFFSIFKCTFSLLVFICNFFPRSLSCLSIKHCLTVNSSPRIELFFFSSTPAKEVNTCYCNFTDGKMKEPGCLLAVWYSPQCLSGISLIWMIAAEQHSWEWEIVTCQLWPPDKPKGYQSTGKRPVALLQMETIMKWMLVHSKSHSCTVWDIQNLKYVWAW